MTQQVCTIVPSKIKLRPLYKIVFEKYLVTIQIQHFTFPLSGTNIQLGQVSQVGQAGWTPVLLIRKVHASISVQSRVNWVNRVNQENQVMVSLLTRWTSLSTRQRSSGRFLKLKGGEVVLLGRKQPRWHGTKWSPRKSRRWRTNKFGVTARLVAKSGPRETLRRGKKIVKMIPWHQDWAKCLQRQCNCQQSD